MEVPTIDAEGSDDGFSISRSSLDAALANNRNDDSFWDQIAAAPPLAAPVPVRTVQERAHAPLRFSQRLSNLADSLPGGLTVCMVVLVCALLPFALGAGASERATIVFGVVCGVLAVACWAFGSIWTAAVIVERRGWLGLILTLVTGGAVGYVGEYGDECGRPVCLSVLGPIAFGCVFLIPACIYALTHT